MSAHILFTRLLRAVDTLMTRKPGRGLIHQGKDRPLPVVFFIISVVSAASTGTLIAAETPSHHTFLFPLRNVGGGKGW